MNEKKNKDLNNKKIKIPNYKKQQNQGHNTQKEALGPNTKR